MKQFKLKEMTLLSLKERRSRKVTFSPTRTVIIGTNETGKSCLIKSIYYTFGAEPHKMHPDWLDAQPISVIRFSVDDEDYVIFRQEKTFALFDNNDDMIGKYIRVSDIGAKLAELFDFKLELRDHQKKVVTPPPAYLFLPFYMDQDVSWQRNWDSFKSLYLPKARLDIINYHTGIRPNQYYQTKNELGILNEGIAVADKEIKLIRGMLNNVKEKLTISDFTVDLEAFQVEITALLAECQILRIDQEDYKTKLSKQFNHKINLDAQLLIVRKTLAETQKDYSYALNKVEDIVPCPTCGAEYENSFAERFGMAQDEQRCYDLILELEEELVTIEADITKLNSKFVESSKTLLEIENQLERKQGEVKLKDLIESEGKKEVQNLFRQEIAAYSKELEERIKLREQLETDLKSLEDKKRGDKIKNLYRGYMKQFLNEVNLPNVRQKSYEKIDSHLSESGSKTPREFMAYYYAILTVMTQYASATFCPLVIDSPNQQAQDKDNLPTLLNFIINRQPKDSQLIMSIEGDHGIDYKADIIQLQEKNHLLQEDGYDDDFESIKPYLDAVVGGQRLFY
jgi:hypothetical protein